MSGITPILDTLLHQVLGKRVDLPSPRDLNEAVKPLQAGTAPQAVHSDSRLDPRPLPVAATTGQSLARPAAPAAPPVSGAGSTSTHFSAAARDIAEVLARFPAPPSALKLVAPLLAAGAEGASPADVAAHLKSSIDSSGLFYESHLARWYRGGLGREQLALEPQMSSGARPPAEGTGPAAAPLVRAGVPASGGERAGQALAANGHLASPVPGERAGSSAATELPRPEGRALPLPPASSSPPLLSSPPVSPVSGPASAPATGASPDRSPAGSPASAAAGSPVLANVESSAPERAARERAAREWATWEQVAREQPVAGRAGGGESSPVRGEGAGHGMSEALQGVVRQQLEMLAMPVLRWEGDVWSGLFMAFTLHFPSAQAREGQSGSGDAGDTGSGGDEWVSELRLEIAGLGDVQVSLRMFREQLELALSASSAALAGELTARREELEARLARCGFEAVSLHIGDREARDD